MKIRRLLEVDLARLAPLPLDEQRRRMQRAIGGAGTFSFGPTRSQLPDIMNVQVPMFDTLGPAAITEFGIIEEHLRKQCRSTEELRFNLQASTMLYSYFRGQNVVSRAYDFGSLPLGLDRGIRYWSSAYYGRGDMPVVTFIDPRGGQGLTSRARQVVFAAMHAGVRERNADFSDAILEIIQLPYAPGHKAGSGTKTRVLRAYTLDTAVAHEFSELDRMLTATLRLWDVVCAEATAEMRKRADGRGTLL